MKIEVLVLYFRNSSYGNHVRTDILKMRKVFKYTGIIVLLYSLFCLGTPFLRFLRNRSIENQISYLSQILDKGYDDRLQDRFPEGKIFSNSILALSVIEFCDINRITDENYARVVDRCVKRLQSSKALEAFNPDMDPPYGMFYNGWSSYVYKSYRRSPLFAYSTLQQEVLSRSTLIEKRIEDVQMGHERILDSYQGANWPADNLIGIMSLDESVMR